jgi:hypothetical protein
MIRPLVVVATNSRRDYLDQMIRPIVFVSIFEFFSAILYFHYTRDIPLPATMDTYNLFERRET